VRVGFIGTDSIGETPAATPSSPGTNRVNAPPRTGPLDRTALARVAGDIRDLAGRVDIVIVIPHWGTQYTNEPERSQRVMARAFIEAGADLVVGGHPHVVQAWETIGGATVVHSLGNFVFDMTSRQTREGLVLAVVTRGNRVVAIDTVPYVIGARDFAPRPARDPDRIETIYDRVRDASEPPFDDLRP
jgi:poly-gamma-glutamate synthesis protein (capsule biosynthesis protein)